MATLSFQDFLKKAGGTVKDIQVSSPPPKETVKPTEPSLIDKFGTRGQDIVSSAGEVIKTAQTGDVGRTLLETGKYAGNVAGNIAGGALDIFSEAIPKSVQDFVGGILTKIGESKGGLFGRISGGKSPTEVYQELQKEYPDVAKSLGDVVNTLTVASMAKVKTPEIKPVIAPTLSKTGEALKTLGEKTTGLVTKMEEPTKIALQSYQADQPSLLSRVKNFFTREEITQSTKTKPITEANTSVRLIEPGTEWQIGVNAKRVSNNLWNDLIQPSLETAGQTIKKSEFFSEIKNRIIKENKDLGRRNTLLNAFESFAEDYKHVSNFSLAKLQEYKEGWAKFVPERAYKGQPIAGSLNEIRSLAAQEARKRIYESLGNEIKTAYLDYGNLQSIAEAGIKSVEGLADKSFTRKIYEAVIDKAVTPIATIAGKVLYKTGEGFQFIGDAGAKKVKDIIKSQSAGGK